MATTRGAAAIHRSPRSTGETSGGSGSPGRTAPARRTTPHGAARTAFEATPIVVDGTLFLSTPFNRVIALDPETGQERWAYDPKRRPNARLLAIVTSRGVSTWLDPSRPAGQACRRRIFVATIDARLIALDAATRRAVRRLRPRREVDLTQGIASGATAVLLPGDLAAGRRRRARRRRLVDRRQPRRRTSSAASCAPSTRAPARCAGAGTRSRARRRDPARATWAARAGAGPAPPTCGRRSPPTRARPRLRADQQPEPGLLRRRAARREPLRQLGGRAARRDRRGRLALPGRASRPLGLRRAGAADARDRHPRRQADPGGRRSRPRWATSSCSTRDRRAAASPSRSGPSRRARCPARRPRRRSRSPCGRARSRRSGSPPDDAWGLTPDDREACRARIARLALRGHLHAAEPRGHASSFPGSAAA